MVTHRVSYEVGIQCHLEPAIPFYISLKNA
jgi:hypothetical protein